MNSNIYACLVLLLACNSLFAQNFNRPTPALVPKYEFQRLKPDNPGYYFMAPFPLGHIQPGSSAFPKPAMILDANGYLVWYMPVYSENLLDFKYIPEENRFSLINYRSANDIRFQILDSSFNFQAEYHTVGNLAPDLHEFKLTSGQNFLISALSDSVMDLSNYTFNGAPGSPQTHAIGYVVQEVYPDNNLLFQWNSNDHIAPAQAYEAYGYSPDYFDYCHGNAIEEYSDTTLLVSQRNLNAVYCINRKTGAVIWQFGGKSNAFTFTNDPGFSGQHDIRVLPNGHITLFDNGNSGPLTFSRAVEYQLDTVLKTAVKVWQYYYTPPFFSPAMGSFQTTSNHLRLVNFGFSFRPNPNMVLVNENLQLVSKLSFADSFLVYRAYVFDFPFSQSQRPEITCQEIAGSLILSAPDGYTKYVWSNGDSSQTTVITQPGEFQVWVNYGSGMIGSLPVTIQNVQDFCNSSSVDTPEAGQENPVTGYFDLLGRPSDRPGNAGFYLVRYKNGEVKAVFME